jgi:hypothetical protein
MTAKHSINLLQAELYPETPLLTLNRVMGTWLLLLAFMVIWAIVIESNYNKSLAKYDELLEEKQQATELANSLELKLKNRKASPALVRNLSTLKLVMQHKGALLDKLTNSNETFAGGFVMAMNDLASMHHKDISLQSIHINASAMSFSGLARSPQAVPAWLAGFEKSKLLSGKAFVNFKLVKNPKGITEFVVSSVESEGGS